MIKRIFRIIPTLLVAILSTTIAYSAHQIEVRARFADSTLQVHAPLLMRNNYQEGKPIPGVFLRVYAYGSKHHLQSKLKFPVIFSTKGDKSPQSDAQLLEVNSQTDHIAMRSSPLLTYSTKDPRCLNAKQILLTSFDRHRVFCDNKLVIWHISGL